MNQSYRSDSEQETAAIASDLARRLPPGAVVLLHGELGAGKTAFVRGFVEGVGIDPYEVSSPTFTVIQEYGGGLVYHVDLYRLGSDEVSDLGLDELPENGALVCIEWAERMPYTMSGAVTVQISYLSDTARELIVKGYSER
ncbi:MAG: tRNA (adenosine(37)-N6)-threonylcarbamoyltransferase complex ATPase subunit type 1 TsaE [Acidobacteria bacterium]|nr:tRNA (adenosine(37)-N6)-threonylcarbamoyltransferase complex ATPase subunit type 1 TsaE [Acidobacteriota bacterium]